MADFTMALDLAFYVWYRPGGVKSPTSSTRGRKARMAELERAYGSKKAAAASAGIGASSWRAWSNQGTSPSRPNQRKLEAAYDRVIRVTRGARITAPDEILITAVVVGDPRRSKYMNKKPKRLFRAERGGAAEAVAAWTANESPEAVADAALAGIESAYGIPFAFEGDDVTVTLE